MRKVLRNKDALAYWNNRWNSFSTDAEEFYNPEIYPIKYIDKIMEKCSKTLDVGCGMGRVVKHYHNKGFNISGCDYSQIAIQKLNKYSPQLNIKYGNILYLPYKNEEFDNILALGIIHSIESLDDINKALKEINRCLKPNGYLVITSRADTLENRLIDLITDWRSPKGDKFHKWCFTVPEFKNKLKMFEIIKVELITNICFLYKFKIFRNEKFKDEKMLRSHGFQLNLLGNFIYKVLKFITPYLWGTTIVITAQKRRKS